MTTILTISQLIFILIGATTVSTYICKFLFWLDTPSKHPKHRKHPNYTNKN